MAPVLARSLNRLSRQSLIELALTWLQQGRISPPYLLNNRRLFEADEEDYLHAPADNVEALRTLYRSLTDDSTKASKRDVIDRIVDGDWRRGLSLDQHAMVDFAYLEQKDTALRWSALKLVPLDSEGAQIPSGDSDHVRPTKRRKTESHGHEVHYASVSAEAFLSALQREISPLVKAHYQLHRVHGLAILRLYIMPSTAFGPRGRAIPRHGRHATDAARIMYIALPDSCPYIYVSLSGSSGSKARATGPRDSKGRVMASVDMAAMKKIVLEAIPKALSRPHQRWALEPTKLHARSLRSMCELRGNKKPGTGGGAYSTFANASQTPSQSPADVCIEKERHLSERHQSVAKRFGMMAGEHHAALDRVHVRLTGVVEPDKDADSDPPEQDTAEIGLTFTGSDVFRGLKELAELGPEFVDLEKMPAWMTGEVQMSMLTV